MSFFEIKNLRAGIEGKEILKGVNLKIEKGEFHAVMGPNGSGKSTLANVVMGNPAYEVIDGEILFNGQNILEMASDERARLGMFLSFQHPVAIPGVSASKFLKRAVEAKLKEKGEKFNASAFIKDLKHYVNFLEMNNDFVNRSLNEGFSGGEKKRLEMLQMLMLKPSLAVLDEVDSGLDIDAIKVVSKAVNELKNGEFSVFIITHYQRILNYIQPQFVHVLMDGKIVTSGGPELVHKLEEMGYDWIREPNGVTQ
ncbi:MAG: Fe-S cluster assembly ATPase SufC [Calditrichia bacterium]